MRQPKQGGLKIIHGSLINHNNSLAFFTSLIVTFNGLKFHFKYASIMPDVRQNISNEARSPSSPFVTD